MCASENEQKQWISKLSKKIPKRGINSQHDQTSSSRFVEKKQDRLVHFITPNNEKSETENIT